MCQLHVSQPAEDLVIVAHNEAVYGLEGGEHRRIGASCILWDGGLPQKIGPADQPYLAGCNEIVQSIFT